VLREDTGYLKQRCLELNHNTGLVDALCGLYSLLDMQDLERKTLFKSFPFGTDSIQGILELASVFPEKKKWNRIAFLTEEFENFGSLGFELEQLKKEGYINLSFKSTEKDNLVEMKDLSLTTSGRTLLKSLRDSSKLGRLKAATLNVFVAIVTSIATTFIALRIFGKG
jgi:hypothetical protein